MGKTRRMRRRDQRGATAVEYSLVAALVAAVVIVSVALLGTSSNELYRCTGDSMASQVTKC
ncbi:MAG TPA: Flp family type IVb pilin [Actinomycetota bacterium]|nr:Flp family type IVb pilin [Actinomycetota bacterium]